MADITKCLDVDECPLAERCYRAQAPDSFWQSYASLIHGLNKAKTRCVHFMIICY